VGKNVGGRDHLNMEGIAFLRTIAVHSKPRRHVSGLETPQLILLTSDNQAHRGNTYDCALAVAVQFVNRESWILETDKTGAEKEDESRRLDPHPLRSR
jgi:hypothetical protein